MTGRVPGRGVKSRISFSGWSVSITTSMLFACDSRLVSVTCWDMPPSLSMLPASSGGMVGSSMTRTSESEPRPPQGKRGEPSINPCRP